MTGKSKSWLGDAEPSVWDPYEVWRQRILLPRLQEQNGAESPDDWREQAVDAGLSAAADGGGASRR